MSRVRIAFCLPHYPGRNHSEFLGVGYLSSILQSEGYETLILDEDAAFFIAAEEGAEEQNRWAMSWVGDRLRTFTPNIVGISLNTANYRCGLRLLRYVRSCVPSALVIVGGPHVTACSEALKQYHSPLFDFGFFGEAEATLLEMVRRFEKGIDLKGIPGTFSSCALLSGENYGMAHLPSIDDLPYPDRKGFLTPWSGLKQVRIIDHYNRSFYAHLPGFRGRRFARVVASRGCDYSCSFCFVSSFWKDPLSSRPRRRVRSLARLLDEIQALASAGVEAIYFDDPTFPLMTERDLILGLAEELNKHRLHLSFGLVTRADEIEAECIRVLSEIGLTYLYFGLETCDSKHLSGMNKELDIERTWRAIQYCEAHGVHADVAYQVALPHQTRRDIELDIALLADRFPKRNVFFSLSAIWPGTPLAEKFGVRSQDYEPDMDHTALADKGLHYFDCGNPDIEDYFSNCSGNYHFIDEETAVWIKYLLIDNGFCKRFDKEGKIPGLEKS